MSNNENDQNNNVKVSEETSVNNQVPSTSGVCNNNNEKVSVRRSQRTSRLPEYLFSK